MQCSAVRSHGVVGTPRCMNVRTNAVRGGWDSDRCRGRLGCSALPLVWLGWQRAQDSGRRDPAHHCEVRCDPTERCHCRSAKPHAVRSMAHVVHVVRCTLCVAARAATEAMRTLVRSELDCFGTRRRGGKRSRDGADIATEEYDIELKTSRDVSSDRVPPARPPARRPLFRRRPYLLCSQQPALSAERSIGASDAAVM